MRQRATNRELTMELIVGTFMFIVLLLLAYFTIVLGRANLFQKHYEFSAVFDEVMGLRKDDPVVVRGMTIGRVVSLNLENNEVHVLASLERPVTLRRGYKVRIISTSILGGRYMEVDEGPKDAPPLPGGMIIRGQNPYDLMAEAAAMIHDLRRSLNEGGIMTNLEAAVASIRGVSAKLDRGEGTIGKLLTDETLYGDMTNIVGDVKATVAQLREVSEKLNHGEGTLGKLLADDTVYTNLQAITANLRDVSQRLEDGQGTLGKLLSKDDTLYRDAAAAAASLKEIAGRIERGEGLLGKITKDDSLYVQAKQVLQEVRAAVDDFRETTPIVSFTSILFGAF